MNRTANRSLTMITTILCFSLLFCAPAFAETLVPPKTTAFDIENKDAASSAVIEETNDGSEAAVPPDQFGPGVPKKDKSKDLANDGVIDEKDGVYLGVFTTTGYCNCAECSSGHNLTASGTIPHASHTIAADPSRFPYGTRLLINGTVYTVEDSGSGVYGDRIDIYYDNHSSAWGHGLQQADVYLIP